MVALLVLRASVSAGRDIDSGERTYCHQEPSISLQLRDVFLDAIVFGKMHHGSFRRDEKMPQGQYAGTVITWFNLLLWRLVHRGLERHSQQNDS